MAACQVSEEAMERDYHEDPCDYSVSGEFGYSQDKFEAEYQAAEYEPPRPSVDSPMVGRRDWAGKSRTPRRAVSF